nr:E1 [Equus caballus papillomavirus 10]
MADEPGTPGEGTSGAWFLAREAVCSGSDSDEEEAADVYEGPDLDFVDNASYHQGNSLYLLQQQEAEEDRLHVQLLKRKYVESPKQRLCLALSPRLQAIQISPNKQPVKRRLFQHQDQDSGLDLSLQNETASNDQDGTHIQVDPCETVGDRNGNGEGGARAGETPWQPSKAASGTEAQPHLDVLRASNRRAAMLARFKEGFGVSFSELTRSFKSDRSCVGDWVVLAFGVREQFAETAKEQLKGHCGYVQFTYRPDARGALTLALLSFTCQKNRDTVRNLMKTVLNVPIIQMLADPPRLRSMASALFWFKGSMSNCTFTHGIMPQWLRAQTMLSQQTEEAVKFDLSDMIQWALDNDITEESKLAYGYALLAESDPNAAAFLSSNNQAKHVRDAATMVRHYKRAQMLTMSMSAWVHRRCEAVEEQGDWRPIIYFLKYQNVEIAAFLQCLKQFFKGVPKRNCLVIQGPPNTGKSTFCMSLINFLAGKVLSFVNSRSQFWLMPLAETKVALLDDATIPAWDYLDTFMRNAMDGNPICIDLKHRAPVQTRCPPLLVTTNVDVANNPRYQYLHTRMACFTFPNDFILDENGQPVHQLTVANWACFFKRLWSRLEFSEQEDEGEDGEAPQTLRVCYRKADGDV